MDAWGAALHPVVCAKPWMLMAACEALVAAMYALAGSLVLLTSSHILQMSIRRFVSHPCQSGGASILALKAVRWSLVADMLADAGLKCCQCPSQHVSSFVTWSI